MNWRGYFYGLCLVLLCACGTDNQDLKDWMQESTKNLKGKVPPLPQVQPVVEANYESEGLLDPFSPSKIEPARRGRAFAAFQPDMNRRRELLESFPLESLRMVGTISKGGGQMVALVLADKALHQVHVGSYMGQNFGQVTRISEREITLKELVEDPSGDWVDRMTTLQLQEAR